MKLNFFTLNGISFLVVLTSFTFFQTGSTLEDHLIGTWSYQQNEGGASTYGKVEKFQDDFPGVEFKKDGKLILWQTIGKCGTSPVQYSNVEGTWQVFDSTIIIKSTSWYGKGKTAWELIDVSPTTLKVGVYGMIKKNH